MLARLCANELRTFYLSGCGLGWNHSGETVTVNPYWANDQLFDIPPGNGSTKYSIENSTWCEIGAELLPGSL